MMIGAKPKTEPTDRSNSPAVISSVIPKVIMPSSGVKANRLLMLLAERKAGDRAVKMMISTASKTSGPNSGAEINLRNNAVIAAGAQKIGKSVKVLPAMRLTFGAQAK